MACDLTGQPMYWALISLRNTGRITFHPLPRHVPPAPLHSFKASLNYKKKPPTVWAVGAKPLLGAEQENIGMLRVDAWVIKEVWRCSIVVISFSLSPVGLHNTMLASVIRFIRLLREARAPQDGKGPVVNQKPGNQAYMGIIGQTV